MLFDPKWEVQTTLEPWRQLLLDGADRIEKEGWWCGSGGIGYCIVTALVDLASKEINVEARKRFLAYIGNNADADLLPIYRWNDTIGRTKEQVLFAMRDCARQE